MCQDSEVTILDLQNSYCLCFIWLLFFHFVQFLFVKCVFLCQIVKVCIQSHIPMLRLFEGVQLYKPKPSRPYWHFCFASISSDSRLTWETFWMQAETNTSGVFGKQPGRQSAKDWQLSCTASTSVEMSHLLQMLNKGKETSKSAETPHQQTY